LIEEEERVLKEIRIHGRGGQGGVTAAQLIAHAAFKEGKWVQAFPHFGAERRGAPVKAFIRISDRPILLHSQVYNPDYVMVFDPKLLQAVDFAHGLKKDGMVIINTVRKPEEITLADRKVAAVDATGIALEANLVVEGAPVVNTAMVGAFAKATCEVKLESVIEAIKEAWPGGVGEKNAEAAKLAFERVTIGRDGRDE